MTEGGEVMGRFTNISVKLKQLRKAEGFTQKEVSEKTGISLNTMKQYECGNRQPGLHNMMKLVEFYRLKLSDFEYEPDGRHKVVK